MWTECKGSVRPRRMGGKRAQPPTLDYSDGPADASRTRFRVSSTTQFFAPNWIQKMHFRRRVNSGFTLFLYKHYSEDKYTHFWTKTKCIQLMTIVIILKRGNRSICGWLHLKAVGTGNICIISLELDSPVSELIKLGLFNENLCSVIPWLYWISERKRVTRKM